MLRWIPHANAFLPCGCFSRPALCFDCYFYSSVCSLISNIESDSELRSGKVYTEFDMTAVQL